MEEVVLSAFAQQIIVHRQEMLVWDKRCCWMWTAKQSIWGCLKVETSKWSVKKGIHPCSNQLSGHLSLKQASTHIFSSKKISIHLIISYLNVWRNHINAFLYVRAFNSSPCKLSSHFSVGPRCTGQLGLGERSPAWDYCQSPRSPQANNPGHSNLDGRTCMENIYNPLESYGKWKLDVNRFSNIFLWVSLL